jgi:DNA-binding transcriptional regulator YiaG
MDTYVSRFWLVAGVAFHVVSLSYLVTARAVRFTMKRATRRAAMDEPAEVITDNIEVVPVVVLSQTFPARPSSIPDVRDFVKRCLAQSPLSEEDNRQVGETVAHALLEAAGPSGAINVSFRIFPDHVEVDVLRSGAQVNSAAGLDALASLLKSQAAGMEAAATSAASGPNGADETAFADWMAMVLRREGMTMEVAARQLGVSVKTVSRWVGGATEPRLRDLRRIRELFGDFPLP